MRIIMKRMYILLSVFAMFVMASLTGCESESQIYEGPSYVMFSDTMNICPVYQDGEPYEVMLAATRSMPYDRTFGVEVIQQKSNAIEGYHYTIESNTVTIPAGELATSVHVKGIYDHIGDSDSLNIKLRLVLLDDKLEWEHYGLETNVTLQKVCPFSIDDFTGYAMVTSTFLFSYNKGNARRLITTERVEGEPNSIMLRDFLCDGYDVKLTLDNSDPLNPKASVREGDIIGPTDKFIGQMIGDNVLGITDYQAIDSKFFTCRNMAALYSLIFVHKEGYLGAFVNTIEWISDVEAEDILKNGF